MKMYRNDRMVNTDAREAGFFVPADAAPMQVELQQRLLAVLAEETSRTESFGSARPVFVEALIWMLAATALYVVFWLAAAHS